jgi:hypothetical protein
MGFPWVFHGFFMDLPWVFHGFSTSPKRSSPGFVIPTSSTARFSCDETRGRSTSTAEINLDANHDQCMSMVYEWLYMEDIYIYNDVYIICIYIYM